MALRWGPEFILIYNDGYAPILGEKHPWALGLPAREVWPEVWHQIEPMHRDILAGTRGAIFADDILLRIQRHKDRWEDARFTLSYSPTPDPTAPSGIGGVFVTAVEIDGADRDREPAPRRPRRRCGTSTKPSSSRWRRAPASATASGPTRAICWW